ncbi:MAG: serine/threonine-protein kinase [Faecalibacterium sp.]
MQTDTSMPAGTLIGSKYEVLKKIGQGGMSVVYLVMDNRLNKNWAMKEVRKDGIKDYEVVKQGLVVETDMLKKLSHPHLPRIVDIIDEDGAFYVVMDYVEGQSLNAILDEYGAQPQDLVIDWAKQLCDVLHYLHTRTPAIIYRDMKPGNVMLRPEGNLTLIDFGIAREFKEKNVADTTCLGTLGYAAPEQFGNQGQTDPRTDIYCLGATLYHLVTGKNPSEPPFEMYPICKINPQLSAGFERIITKCIQRNPNDRYQSCAELMYDLEHYNEIDDKYRKKQIGKLAAFCVPMALSIVSACFSVFCYQSILTQQRENYEEQLSVATTIATQSVYNETFDDSVVTQYTDTISIDQSRDEAYLGLISYCSSVGQTQAGLEIVCIAVDAGKGGINQNNDLLLEIANLYFGGNYKDDSFSVDYLKAAKYYAMVDVTENPEAEYLQIISSALSSFSADVDWALIVSTLDQFTAYNAQQSLSVDKIKNNQLAAGVYIANKREIVAQGVDPYEQAIALLLIAEADLDDLQNDVDLGTSIENSDALPGMRIEIYASLASDYYTAYTVDSTATDYDKALEYLNLLLAEQEDETDREDTEFKMADVTVQKGVTSEIDAIYKSLMTKYSTSARAYLDYAVYCFGINDTEQALSLYQQASKMSDAEANSNYSKLKIKLQNAGLL